MTQYIKAGTKAQFFMEDAEDVKLTFTLTLTVGEWRLLMRELGTTPASQTLGMIISTMLGELSGKMHTTYDTTGWSGATPVKDD